MNHGKTPLVFYFMLFSSQPLTLTPIPLFLGRHCSLFNIGVGFFGVVLRSVWNLSSLTKN